MSWKFRKRVKVIPGVYLNFSKSGISTTIGVKGASVNFNKTGTYLNTGIPGTGIYDRQKISNKSQGTNETTYIPPVNPEDNIISSSVQEITSQNMEGVKEAILLAHSQRKDLSKDVLNIKASLAKSKTQLLLSYILIYGLIKKDIPLKIKEDIKAQKEAIKGLKQEIEKSFVALDIDFTDDLEKIYSIVTIAFEKLIQSKKIWDVTGAYEEDTRQTRSAAGTTIKRKETLIGFKQLPDIKSKYEALYFKNLNGPDVYIYPNFVIMYKKKGEFAVIDLDELNFECLRTRFLENGKPPKDAKIIDYTWAKVNKNGSQDKRFKGNYQIPVVAYGDILLKTNTGMNENWQFSNYENCYDFGSKFLAYKQLISELKIKQNDV